MRAGGSPDPGSSGCAGAPHERRSCLSSSRKCTECRRRGKSRTLSAPLLAIQRGAATLLAMTTAERIYTLAMRATRRVLPLLARGEGKLARGVRGRRGASDRLTAWAARSREPGRPLVWFHAPSVGEGLQAAAVIDALRELRPDTQIAYTFFSPSAERLAERIAA